MDLRPASSLDISALVELLNKGFEDYLVPIKETQEGFLARAEGNDILLDHSRVAFAEDGKPIGLALLAVRGEECWLGGMAVLKEYRGEGVGRELLDALVQNARKLRCRRMSLEVIVGNEPAYNLYRKYGFQEFRTLSCYRRVGRGEGDEPGVEDATFKPTKFKDLVSIYKKDHCWQKAYKTLEDVQGLDCHKLESDVGVGYLVLAHRGSKTEIIDIKPPGVLQTALTVFCGGVEEVRAINVYEPELKEEYEEAGFEEFVRQREMELFL